MKYTPLSEFMNGDFKPGHVKFITDATTIEWKFDPVQANNYLASQQKFDYSDLVSLYSATVPKPSWLSEATPRSYTNPQRSERELSEMSLRLLKHAREDFEQNGGAVRTLRDDHGKRCALGSLEFAWNQENGISEFSWDMPNVDVLLQARKLLDQTSKERHGFLVHAVNDCIGFDAAKECFDFAIKALEGQLEPEDPKDVS